MVEYGLTDHDWLNDMYQIRDMWIPIFSKNIFFANMTTSQRSESINAFVKGYVTKKTALKEFFTQFE